MKKLFIILLVASKAIVCMGQENDNFLTDITLELGYCHNYSFEAKGFILKAKKTFIEKEHIESKYGILLLRSKQIETNWASERIDGSNTDAAAYIVSEWAYSPFKRKSLYIALEPYLGLASNKSVGTVEIPELEIKKDYWNRYTYLNGGLSLILGYEYKGVGLNCFLLSSLRGIYKYGWEPLGDVDSKAYAGVSVSYKW